MRKEKDSMGEMEVPDDAYWGASTKRALLNFPISDLKFSRSFIRALCLIKQYACIVNEQDGLLDQKKSKAIQQASREAADGKFDDQFVIDIFQTGSGTSTNMNANEVIANRAIEILTGSKGGEENRSLIHPNDHVNAGMSSNDAIPSAIHIAALIDITEKLEPALKILENALEKKSQEFMGVIKTGRTHLQDATPILLGQEFLGYKGQIENACKRLQYAKTRLQSLALGGTAVGTGINTKPHFAGKVIKLISQDLKIELKETTNHFQAQSTIDEIVDASGVLKTIAVSLLKIANDIRFMGCGPRAGFGEIQLPAVQPGSSIMPGKVNPVIAESLTMVCAQVIGNDVTINVAGQSGNFELNVMLPVAAYNLLQSINLLASASLNFAKQCIEGLEATAKGPQMVEAGLSLCTALVPAIGYDASAQIAHKAYKTGKTIKEIALAETSLSEAELNSLLDPHKMITQSD